MRDVYRGLLFCSVSALSSCGSSPEATPPPGKFSEIYAAIFPVDSKAQCGFCHGLPANDKSNGFLSTGMDSASVAYQALVGKTSSSSMCGGRPYVIAGNPDGSLLYQKLTSPPCGGHMPLGGDSLTSDQLAMVRSWIADGAKDD